MPGVSGSPITQAKSRWVPVAWNTVPGFASDPVGEAWSAWMRSCAKPGPVYAGVCSDARRMANASDADKRAWMMQPTDRRDDLAMFLQRLEGAGERVITA